MLPSVAEADRPQRTGGWLLQVWELCLLCTAQFYSNGLRLLGLTRGEWSGAAYSEHTGCRAGEGVQTKGG